MHPESAPLVSVGISFYNDARTLAEAIRSVLNQRYTNWELILIDDGSRDGSREVAQSFEDPRIRLFADGTNRGLCERLNQQVREARGVYFARMDADDVMHPDRLARQVAHLEAHPAVDVVDTAMIAMTRDGVPCGLRERATDLAYLTVPDLLRGDTPAHATVLGRLAWFRRHPYNPAYVRAEDLELWVRALPDTRFAHLDTPLYFVREGAVNVRNYVLSQQTCRRIYRLHGPVALGWARTATLLLRSWGKELAYRAFGLFGAQGWLAGRRSQVLAPEALAEASRALAEARALRGASPVGLPADA